jgi:thiamine phosphate synthase YjbQ (UPF0047 family)
MDTNTTIDCSQMIIESGYFTLTSLTATCSAKISERKMAQLRDIHKHFIQPTQIRSIQYYHKRIGQNSHVL